MSYKQRKFNKLAVSFFTLIFMYMSFFMGASTTADAATTPKLKDKKVTIEVGENYLLEVKNKPKSASYEWVSDKKAVVVVDNTGNIKGVSEGSAKVYSTITYGSNKKSILVVDITVKEATGKMGSKVPVDKNGLDEKGRMVAYFGSPVIDGGKDPLWDKAQSVIPAHVSGNTNTKATFKALWDDRALYILAEVKDTNLSVQSNTPYMQDSVEIFLDELNDKTSEYGPDDLHIRINYENLLSIDNGNPQSYYSATQKVKDGYTVETRIALKNPPKNNSVLGIELQINDAEGDQRVATLNVFDNTGFAWNNPQTFGEIILVGKQEKDKSGLNPYDLLNLIKQTLEINFSLYENSSIVYDEINKVITEGVINGKLSDQSKIDNYYKNIKQAVQKLKFTEEAANEKHFVAVPDEYRMESDKSGKIETLNYSVKNIEDGLDAKKLHVYLPYGYDPADKNKKYNVLYLMHGGGENEDLIFGGPGQNRELKKIIDNMIARGDIDPLIVVTPTVNGGKNDVALFHEELVADIIPLVETKYKTHTKSGSKADIKASREHRAFGGFSMGSVTTWYTFIHALDYVKYYIPLSGDSWIIEQGGGSSQSAKTAQYLADVVKKSGYTPKDYYIFSATGDLDIAYPNLKPQVDAMKKIDNVFIYSSDVEKGNFYFLNVKGGTHHWSWQNQYIYNILPDLFQ